MLKLLSAANANFFTCLEKLINFKIPLITKNLLSLNYYNSAYAFINFDDTALKDIEAFMCNDFHIDMIQEGESVKDYLGHYWQSQERFKLVGGQINMIKNIADTCRKLYEVEPVGQKPVSNEGYIIKRYDKFPHYHAVLTDKTLGYSPDETKVIIKKLFAVVFKWMSTKQTLREV